MGSGCPSRGDRGAARGSSPDGAYSFAGRAIPVLVVDVMAVRVRLDLAADEHTREAVTAAP